MEGGSDIGAQYGKQYTVSAWSKEMIHHISSLVGILSVIKGIVICWVAPPLTGHVEWWVSFVKPLPVTPELEKTKQFWDHVEYGHVWMVYWVECAMHVYTDIYCTYADKLIDNEYCYWLCWLVLSFGPALFSLSASVKSYWTEDCEMRFKMPHNKNWRIPCALISLHLKNDVPGKQCLHHWFIHQERVHFLR